MKAFAYDGAHALDAFAVTLRDLPEPEIRPTDLLVAIKAFSLNPVDYKVRSSRNGGDGGPVILGGTPPGSSKRSAPRFRDSSPATRSTMPVN